jgi:hypothetical protein
MSTFTELDPTQEDSKESAVEVIHQVVYRLIGGGLGRAAYSFRGKDPLEAIQAKLEAGQLLEVDSLAPSSDSANVDLFVHPQAVAAVLISEG